MALLAIHTLPTSEKLISGFAALATVLSFSFAVGACNTVAGAGKAQVGSSSSLTATGGHPPIRRFAERETWGF